MVFTSALASSDYYFPLNRIEVGYFNNSYTGKNTSVNQYFSPPYLPVFWHSVLRVKNGYMLMYERNFYHTKKYVSLDWGASGASWTSQLLGNQFYTVALFLDLSVWFVRSKYADLYITYSIAGPTYMSRNRIDARDMGGNFIFQDTLGVGALLGTQKHVNVSVKIGHYSNGSLLPFNPGIDVPFIFSIGYAFG